MAGRWGGRASPHVSKDGGPGSGPQDGGGSNEKRGPKPYYDSGRDKWHVGVGSQHKSFNTEGEANKHAERIKQNRKEQWK